jgi:trigger factor
MSNSILSRLAPTQVELEIPITSDELAAAEERAFRRLVKKAKIPGFRPGKVPRRVFEQTYGTDSITHQAIEEVVPEVYARAVREHDLEPVDRPKMEVLEEDGGRPTRVKAIVEVRPEIALGQYKELAIPRPNIEITDADVQRSLEALAKDRGTLVPMTRPAEMGDIVTIDYDGTIDGQPFEGGSARGQVTELAEGRLLRGFAEGVVGMTAGGTKSIAVEFPADYVQAELAGKSATFALTLQDVKHLEPQTIDDEFARSVSSTATLDELREDVRRRLAAIAESRVRRATGNAILEKLLASHDFPLPETMVDGEVNHLMNEAVANAARAGKDFSQYLSDLGKTEEGLRTDFRRDAESRVKSTLLIEQIAKVEHIAATPADVQEELEALGRQYGQPVSRIRKALGNGLLSLMDGIVRNKTLDFLIDNAKGVTEETPAPSS